MKHLEGIEVSVLINVRGRAVQTQNRYSCKGWTKIVYNL